MKNPHFIFTFFSFYPENIPYSEIIKEMSVDLINKGCTVEIITYEQTKKQIASINKIEQLRKVKFTYIKKLTSSKLLSYIWFPVASFFISLNKKNCYIITPSTPPVLMPLSIALAKLIGANRFKFIYHCQDIHPEAMRAAGKTSYFNFILEKIEKFSLNRSDKIITLSEEMKKTLCKKTNNKNIFIVDNYIPHTSSGIQTKKINNNEIKLIYAGNIGIFQNLELLVDILLNENIQHISLTIIGDGLSKKNILEIIKKHKNQHKVKILAPVASEEIGKIISTSDFGVVSLIPNMSRYAKPSKISSYLAEGVPVLCISDENTELEHIINKEKLGAYCYSNDRASIIKTLKNLNKLSHELDKNTVISYYKKSNSKENLLDTFFNTVID